MEQLLIRRKIIIALFANMAILGMEIAGLVLSVQRHGIDVFQYYTENSNYFTLIASATFCVVAIISLIKKRPIALWVHTLRYISTVCLTITLVIVLFVLIPLYPSTLAHMLFQNSNLFQHLLCPTFSIVSFLYLENWQRLPTKHIYFALLPTMLYGVICLVLNFLRIITGPYPFFYIYVLPWYYSAPSLVGILLVSYFIAFILIAVRNKQQRREKGKAKILQKKET